MRERLIELMKKALDKHESTIENYVIYTPKFVAEHLLENGVIVPPCKVGDKVYRIVGDDSILAWEIISMECFVDEIGFVDDSDNWIAFDDIGKTVFLTREDAEKALQEVKGK